MCDLKAAEMYVQYSLIQELMLYKFKQAIMSQLQPKTFVVLKVQLITYSNQTIQEVLLELQGYW